MGTSSNSDNLRPDAPTPAQLKALLAKWKKAGGNSRAATATLKTYTKPGSRSAHVPEEEARQVAALKVLNEVLDAAEDAHNNAIILIEIQDEWDAEHPDATPPPVSPPKKKKATPKPKAKKPPSKAELRRRGMLLKFCLSKHF